MFQRKEDIITIHNEPIHILAGIAYKIEKDADQIPKLGGKLIGSDINWRGLTILKKMLLEGFVLSSGGHKALQVSAI